MSDLSSKLLELIQESGMSYDDLRKITGISKSALQRYATGETEKIPLDRVEKIAQALNVTPEYLLGWEIKKPTIPEDRELDTVDRLIIEGFMQLSPESKAVVLDVIKAMK